MQARRGSLESAIIDLRDEQIPDGNDAETLALEAPVFTVSLKNGTSVRIENATAYQPEGPLITFFSSGSSRQSIDSWTTRLASYRTADIISIERSQEAAFATQPVLVAV